ncbi:MAG TPA: hypothetical protein VGK84_05035 [Candidatus Tumulicola sp.]|jgi:hypothetical protein
MSPQLARTIAKLYSKRWQARYGDEFVALLESLPPTSGNVIDACLPALGRHARHVAVALAVAACATVSVAGTIRHHAPQEATVAWHVAHGSLSAQTVCRPNPKVSHSAFAGWHRCLD